MANELVDSIAEQIADSLTADKRKSGGFIPKIKSLILCKFTVS
ncbi:MAG: hypothetical protein ACLUKN_05525 [Bacilli bacterium]